MRSKRLEGLWEGDWPYHTGDGVGIRLEGIPTDIKAFIWTLAMESCHPKASERILARLRERGYDLLTVMYGLNFRWIRDQLARIGVTLTIIPPMPGWEPKYEDGPWPKGLLEKVDQWRAAGLGPAKE